MHAYLRTLFAAVTRPTLACMPDHTAARERRMSGVFRTVSACLAVCAMASGAGAETVAEFYKGKMLTVITWQGPGTSFDAYARLIGRHMGKHLPGEPSFRVALMVGGDGIVAANHLANIAPKDGTAL